MASRDRPDVRISKFLSLVLRHQPQAAGVELAPDGWADVNDLLAGCARAGLSVTRQQLQQVVAGSSKQRFELNADGSRIRARQGHSVCVDLGLDPAEPPETLYHGTAARNLPDILRDGLRKGNRLHVHLSGDEQTAIAVGRRHGPPLVLRVRAGQLHADGATFFLSSNGIWLTEHVPPEYLQLPADSRAVPQRLEDRPDRAQPVSCGVLVFRHPTAPECLMLRKASGRPDIPKGHREPGETERQCALRELEEETGILSSDVQLDPEFRFETSYRAAYQRLGGRIVCKTLIVFLGWLHRDIELQLRDIVNSCGLPA